MAKEILNKDKKIEEYSKRVLVINKLIDRIKLIGLLDRSKPAVKQQADVEEKRLRPSKTKILTASTVVKGKIRFSEAEIEEKLMLSLSDKNILMIEGKAKQVSFLTLWLTRFYEVKEDNLSRVNSFEEASTALEKDTFDIIIIVDSKLGEGSRSTFVDILVYLKSLMEDKSSVWSEENHPAVIITPSSESSDIRLKDKLRIKFLGAVDRVLIVPWLLDNISSLALTHFINQQLGITEVQNRLE